MSRYSDNDWPPYVSMAERREQAAFRIANMKDSCRDVSPVEITGRKIATTFWGAAWCKNLEAYSDYSNRLPRGRSYVRSGSVIDLQIQTGRILALVSGTELYAVKIAIKPLAKKRWTDIKGQCAGQIASLVELLQGSLSKGVMEIVARKDEGLFPKPREISFDCSCPDRATMCKHVAATLYGVGARLDHRPELLFTLRGLDPTEMVEAAIDQPKAVGKTSQGRILKTDELSSVFGVDIDTEGLSAEEKPVSAETSKDGKGVVKTDKPSASEENRKKAASRKVVDEKESTPKRRIAKRRYAKRKNTTRKSSKKASVKRTDNGENSNLKGGDS